MFDKVIHSPVFRNIKEEELSRLLNSVPYRVKKYPSGQIIIMSGDLCVNLMIVLSGSVKGEMVDFSGKTLQIEDVEAPNAIAAAFLFGNNNKMPVNVSVNADAEVLFIPKDSVIRLFQSNTMILNNYLNLISNRAQFLAQKMKFLSFKTIRQKLAHYILSVAGNDRKKITLSRSQQELSVLFGVTRPALARELGEMEQEGIIQANRRNITILKKEELNRLLR